MSNKKLDPHSNLRSMNMRSMKLTQQIMIIRDEFDKRVESFRNDPNFDDSFYVSDHLDPYIRIMELIVKEYNKALFENSLPAMVGYRTILGLVNEAGLELSERLNDENDSEKKSYTSYH